jgi:hypothetical protein
MQVVILLIATGFTRSNAKAMALLTYIKLDLWKRGSNNDMTLTMRTPSIRGVSYDHKIYFISCSISGIDGVYAS